ncbi:hypothetical protein JZK55_00450 [Dissulfurispira thermophila]|uniref:TonB C-terminal domain-containing protein n=2 Tax=root TaxID=1 RepID=A0A7G1GYY9_9BACT|nr:cell envelope integrity protein TolA [Dissulfurispira thermophila]BCB95123.1 hypothetical protein JZK55_00450 [Dissulfurispira thermophila]
MKTSGIYSAFTFSLFLHVLIAAIALVIAQHSSLYKLSQTYIVTIVDSTAFSNQQSATVSSRPSETEVHGSNHQQAKSETQSINTSPKSKNTSKRDEIAIKEQIEALQAKKKIEKMAALRKIVDIGGIKSEVRTQKSEAKTKDSTSGNQAFGGDYYSTVINKIKQQWIFPESIDKDLLAIVTIKIAKDGSVTISKIERSSGNALFDRSALRAISKASPLPPPPQEIEIGVRFKP